MKFFRTPKNKLDFVMVSSLFLIVIALIEFLNLYLDYVNGKYRVNADSLGLGFAQLIFAALFFAPFILGCLFWIVRQYPAEASFWGYNANRPITSITWTVILGLLICDELAVSLTNLSQSNFLEFFQNISLAYCGLLFRAAIIFRGEKELKILS